MLLALQNVDKYYGSQMILDGVSFSLDPKQRVALVGRNGAGKSTLIKLLLHEEEPSGGKVLRARGIQLGCLRQDPVFPVQYTVREVLERAFHELDALEAELEAFQRNMNAEDEQQLQQYHDLLEHYQLRGGYERRARLDGVSLAFGFRGREEELVKGLSGGERTRLALAALLISNPEVLLLDEPTNHLDIAMREWLEGFLLRYPGAMVVVSHDRTFLDTVATHTAYLQQGRMKVYNGNYSHFRQQLEEQLATQAQQFATQQRQIDIYNQSVEQMRRWAFKNSQLFKRVQAMEKRLGRMEDQQVDAVEPDEDVAEVVFDCDPSATVVIEAQHLTKRFAGRTLFQDVQLTVRAGERIAIVGANGAGKSTFLKTLLGLLPSDNPKTQIRTGPRVSVGYYDQQLRGVDPENTLYDEVRALTNSDQQTRNLLGAYLFPYLTQSKKVHQLSGGERARLALLKLSLERHNLLILDEPTNHLDMEMLESLEEALRNYPGTLIMVSHDRAFMEGLADQIWLIEDGLFYSYPGNYSYYKQKHVIAKAPEVVEVKATKPKRSGPSLWHLKRRAETLEQDIERLEAELNTAHANLEQADAYADFAALGQAVSDIEERLLQTMSEWDTITADIAERES